MTDQEELELAELIGEFSEQLKEQAETLGEIVDKVEALTERLSQLEERLKKLEPDDTLDAFKKLLEEKKPDPFWPNPAPSVPVPWTPSVPHVPSIPWPDPNQPLIGIPNKCNVCGIDFGNGSGWGYVCGNLNCPTRVYAISGTATYAIPTQSDTNKVDFTTKGPTTTCGDQCACGQNPTCQCNN